MMIRIGGIAISDKHGRDFATYVGDSNCFHGLVDSDEIFGEVSRCRVYGHVV